MYNRVQGAHAECVDHDLPAAKARPRAALAVRNFMSTVIVRIWMVVQVEVCLDKYA